MIGCFGMTELAHGSNVAGLETTATFDEDTDEFVIHTPNVSATKWWIGGESRELLTRMKASIRALRGSILLYPAAVHALESLCLPLWRRLLFIGCPAREDRRNLVCSLCPF